MVHNKTLAAQLYQEFRRFFPHNAVEYFVSYYDYYQPEAYVPATDTYIEKEATTNDEIDRMRLSATRSLFERRDVLIVASVSCIYGLGSPEDYYSMALPLERGQRIGRDQILRKLVEIQYERNDIEFGRGTFRVRGDIVEVFPSYDEFALRIELFGDEIDALVAVDPLTGKAFRRFDQLAIYPKTHFVAPRERTKHAADAIKAELAERLAALQGEGKLLEAQRLHQRTMFDLEMLREIGYCHGIENYSRHLTGRSAGEPPPTLLDYLPPDALVIVDESHQTVPQIRGMFHGDRSRKQVLVDYGFRLPSALDNRPLNFEEWERRVHQVVFVSATPGPYELQRAGGVVVEQIIRPTGLVDPPVEVRPVRGQVDDLLAEIRARAAAGERVLVTTLTKRMAEDLTQYYQELGVRVRYLHSDIETLERVEILRDLRRGRVRRPGRHQPAARRPGPARGLAGRHPRRRQGRVPPVGRRAHPDLGPRGAQRARQGHHVRRRHDRQHARGDRGDRPAARRPGGLQRRARHHARVHREADRRRAVERVRARLPRRAGGQGAGRGVHDAGRDRREDRPVEPGHAPGGREPGVREGGVDPGRDQEAARAEPGRGRRLVPLARARRRNFGGGEVRAPAATVV